VIVPCFTGVDAKWIRGSSSRYFVIDIVKIKTVQDGSNYGLFPTSPQYLMLKDGDLPKTFLYFKIMVNVNSCAMRPRYFVYREL
jgi:hypothetical protein